MTITRPLRCGALVAAFALAASASCGAPVRPADDPEGPPGRSTAPTMDFQPPGPAVTEFWCQASSVPETARGAGQCFRDAEECRSRTEHLWNSYGMDGSAPPCHSQPRVHCFDMNSQGTVYEVCRATAEGCAAHHETQTHDAWVHAITPSCEERP